MKNILILFTSLMLFGACATQPKTALEKTKEAVIAEADWYLFENEAQDYSVRFPQTPTSMPILVDTEMGKLETKLLICEVVSGKDAGFYAVGATDYPFGLVHSNKTDMLDDFFRGSVDGAVENVKGKLLSETKIDMDGFEGRAIEVDIGNNQIMLMNTYLIGNRMYTLQVLNMSDNVKSLYTKRFFDSFKVSETYKTAARQEVAVSETDAGWQLYESKVGAYKITFPKIPTESKDIVDSDMGKLSVNSATGLDGEVMYMAVYIDYPSVNLNSETTDLEEFYTGVINGSATSTNAKVEDIKTIKINEREGREVKMTIDSEGVLVLSTMRILLVGSRMYIIQVAAEGGEDIDASVKQFMDSFELIE